MRPILLAASVVGLGFAATAQAQARAQAPARAAAQAQTSTSTSTSTSVSRADYMKGVDNRFATIDINHDGSITKAEVASAEARAIEQLSIARTKQLREQFQRLDTNKDGKLNVDEFLAAAPAIKSKDTPEEILAVLDTDHDGKVSAAEFRAPEAAKFTRFDLNRDGIVTPAEIQQAAGGK